MQLPPFTSRRQPDNPCRLKSPLDHCCKRRKRKATRRAKIRYRQRIFPPTSKRNTILHHNLDPFSALVPTSHHMGAKHLELDCNNCRSWKWVQRLALLKKENLAGWPPGLDQNPEKRTNKGKKKQKKKVHADRSTNSYIKISKRNGLTFYLLRG